ncbi:MAG: chromate transporter [Spirochaetaceae bacterium]|nr:chromate transporter [Spirochaetaceae bacterium]
MKIYLELIWTFFKMGCVTFGGGYAMLPVLERELVQKKGWAAMDEVMDYFAVGQVTPGVIAVNVSTFIGYKKKGIPGGILATLGFVLPSLIIITVIAAFLNSFAQSAVVRHAFGGVRIAVGALVLEAVVKLSAKAIADAGAVIICAAAFVLSVVFKASPVFLVIASGVAGLLLYMPGAGKAAGPSGSKPDEPGRSEKALDPGNPRGNP